MPTTLESEAMLEGRPDSVSPATSPLGPEPSPVMGEALGDATDEGTPTTSPANPTTDASPDPLANGAAAASPSEVDDEDDSWVRRTSFFLAEPIRLVADVAKAGFRTITGEEDFHLGSTIRCAASWVIGDRRPYPKLSPEGAEERHRKKIKFLAGVKLSSLSYPGTAGMAVSGDLNLSDREFVFTPTAASCMFRSELFKSSESLNGFATVDKDSAADDEGTASSDADALESASAEQSVDSNASADASEGEVTSDVDDAPPPQASVTEPLVFLYSLIRDVEMPMHIQQANEVRMRIILKTFHIIDLDVPGTHALQLFQTLVAAAFVIDLEQLPAFDGGVVDEGLEADTVRDTGNTPPNSESKPADAGSQWMLIDVRKEFQRMDFGDKWRLYHGNENYETCPTYPAHLYVPASVSDEVVEASAAFRSKGRFPALSFYHRTTGAALLRCAQPLSGLSSKRSRQDEELVKAALATEPKSRSHILDARPRLNALANRANGKGYENCSNYGENCEGCFLDIDNIHVMRSSIEAVVIACSMTDAVLAWTRDPTLPDAAPFVAAIDKTGWLYHLQRVLDGAMLVVDLMHGRGESVLVHCSDGWDRTAQLSTLAQVMLDPHSRTIDGFMAVIHKEWLSFGHKFEDRLGLLNLPRREVSPVFTQCLDCIWQLMQLYPTAFEFSSSFLVALHYAVNSSEYGTFLCNSEKERLSVHRLHARTRCLWRLMHDVAPLHKSGRYAPADDVLRAPPNESDLKLFSALYIPRCLPRDTLHHPRKSVMIHNAGGDPEWPEILTVTGSKTQ